MLLTLMSLYSSSLLYAAFPLPIRSTRSSPIKRSGTGLASGNWLGRHRSGLRDNFWLSKGGLP